MTEKEPTESALEEIILSKGRSKDAVIPLLQAIQNKYNYLPDSALKHICNHTEITPEQITGVASFYSQFRMQPVGEHIIKVCVGTACHVKGADQVYNAIRRHFNLTGEEGTDASGKYTVEKVSCLGCCTLAPVVQIDEITYGHVTSDTVGNMLQDFEQNSVSGKLAPAFFKDTSGNEIQGEIRIGLGSCCVASGSEEVKNAVEASLAGTGIRVSLKNVGCIGMCHRVPLVEVIPEKGEPTLYAKVKPEDVDAIINKHFKPQSPLSRIKNNLYQFFEKVQTNAVWEGVKQYAIDAREKQVTDFLDRQIPIATRHRGTTNPLDLNEYRSYGGFTALQTSLKEMEPASIIATIRESGLRGRGGAGFPTGQKWSLVAGEKEPVKYLICNGDEGDPGAFMDRMLLESYPYRVIEGMLIAAHAIGASAGFFYIRAEYPLALKRINQALVNCREQNLLGDNILGTGFCFDITIYEGAGAFVCGEETALIKSMEGQRGYPVMRPPYPASKGLCGKPTLINNTETFAQVSYILAEGANKFNAIGSATSKGTKVFALAGKINRGGLIEVPMGITVRQIVEEIGGGVQNGKKFKAVQIGGPSGGCIPAALFDIPVDYESLLGAGSMMGSGGLVVMDEDDCMVDIARYFLKFTQHESCGKCTFCRVGTKRMLDILDRITTGKGSLKDIEELEYLAGWTKKGSLCGLGKSAPNPILSTLKYFRDEYLAHLEGKCPAHKCTDLIRYEINDKCIGCTLCAQKCPTDAILFKPHQKHEVIHDLCIKCNACKDVCPEDAVEVF